MMMLRCKAGETYWIGGLVNVDSVQGVDCRVPKSITV
jgi:hypothetical protein